VLEKVIFAVLYLQPLGHPYSVVINWTVFYRSMHSNGAVMPSYDVRLSVCLSVCDVGDSWSHMLG